MIPAERGKFGAYHGLVDGGAPLANGAGKYADIIVVIGGNRLVFSREGGYRPQWRVGNNRHDVDLIGGQSERDPGSYYTYARLMKSGPDAIVVHWRHFRDIATLTKAVNDEEPLHPHGITGAVHELFTIYPDGKVEREVRVAGGTRYQDWIDDRLATRQTLKLTPTGIQHGAVKQGERPPFHPRPAVAGNPVKKQSALPPKLFHWSFDDGLAGHEDAVTESISKTQCPIHGLMTLYKKGVSGTALALDGYYTDVSIKGPTGTMNELTVSAWVALDAYPYNTAALAHHSDEATGWYLGVDPYGHPVLRINGDEPIVSDAKLPLWKWAQVAATVRDGQARLYVNGQLVKSETVPSPIRLPTSPVVIGRNRARTRCSDPVRGEQNNIPIRMAIQGLMDEVSIFRKALTAGQVKTSYAAFAPSDPTSDLAKGILPGMLGAGEFGASYASLNFSDVWDRLWRDPAGSEVVVRFDSNPCSVVFWRGTAYAPNWVTDNNRWMADQSSEIWGPHGCSEHMGDKQARHSYVRIIENTPARVLVHWRYPCVDVGYVPEGSSYWTDEYYTIYPDGRGVRHVAWNGGTGEDWGPEGPGFQDIQFLTNPGETALDVMDLQAMTVANLRGETEALTWRPPNRIPGPGIDKPRIHLLNSKSRYKVFAMLQEGRLGQWGHNEQSRHTRDPFAGPWNHWPMHLLPSDGRFVVGPDRVSHFALGASAPGRRHGSILLYGFTDRGIAALQSTARSWIQPPTVSGVSGAASDGYDRTERAFVLTASSGNMSFTINASTDNPVVNPCFVVRNWGCNSRAGVRVNGEAIRPGADFRQGVLTDVDGIEKMVIWLRQESASPVKFTIGGAKPLADYARPTYLDRERRVQVADSEEDDTEGHEEEDEDEEVEHVAKADMVLKIGATATDFGGMFAGRIDDVAIYDVALKANEIAELAAGKPVKKGLVANYRFNGGPEDALGGGAASLMDGGVIEAAGREGTHSLKLDGEKMWAKSPAKLNFHNGFTWSAWIKTTAADGTVVSYCGESGKWRPGGRALLIEGRRLVFDIGWVGQVGLDVNVSDGQWHHVAVTGGRGLDGARIYVDGKAAAAEAEDDRDGDADDANDDAADDVDDADDADEIE